GRPLRRGSVRRAGRARRRCAVMHATQPPRRALRVLYDEIDQRAHAIAREQSPWPCQRGCDACCRRLAEPPSLTRAEWAELWSGFLQLDPATRAEVRRRVAEVAATAAPSQLVTCPMLDRDAGACRVYAHRPAACRTYGFYVTRTDGNWCDQIERMLAE